MPKKHTPEYDANGNELYYNDGDKAIRVGWDKAARVWVLYVGKKKVKSSRKKSVIVDLYYQHIGKKAVDITDVSRLVLRQDDPKHPKGHSKHIKIPPAEICKLFSEIYYENPHKAEAMSGIHNLGKLASMDFDFAGKAPRILLDDILSTFVEHPNNISMKQKLKEANSYWTEFITLVTAYQSSKPKYLSDIQLEAIKYWETEINQVATKKKYRPNWLSKTQKQSLDKIKIYPRKVWQRKRIGTVRNMLKFYRRNKILSITDPRLPAFNEVMYVMNDIIMMEKPKRLPITIEPDVFKNLHNNASLRMRIMMRLGVQCSFTFKDMVDLTVDDIKWDKSQLWKQREKEDTPRVAYISKDTLKMMKRLMKDNDSGEYVFAKKGALPSVSSLQDKFLTLRKKLGYGPDVKFKNLRKTCLTEAGNFGASELAVSALAGHSMKIKDVYVGRTLKQVEGACKYIADEYFPKE